ncbi:MAG: alpha/beta fold hydrolase [Pseudomonadota bacterium]|nr:alpha/beta fold hydrolase [Pseudomonadota bacterium]
MTARSMLRALLLVQGVCAILVGYALARALDAGFITGLAGGTLALVLVRLAISANNFRISARTSSFTPHEHRIGAAGALRLFGEEFVASMRFSSWIMPRAVPGMQVYSEATRWPVLLVHGYGCNSGNWAYLTPLLDAARISYATIDLAPVTASMDRFSPLVEEGVRALLAATGAARVVIVAHSMGGLVARAWMRDAGVDRVASVITMGTPHQGTAMATIGIGKNALQMRRDSAWLRALAASESAATRALITSIYTHHDNIVTPQTSSELDGARNLGFGGVGHVALAANPRILAAVMRALESGATGEVGRLVNAGRQVKAAHR